MVRMATVIRSIARLDRSREMAGSGSRQSETGPIGAIRAQIDYEPHCLPPQTSAPRIQRFFRMIVSPSTRDGFDPTAARPESARFSCQRFPNFGRVAYIDDVVDEVVVEPFGRSHAPLLMESQAQSRGTAPVVLRGTMNLESLQVGGEKSPFHKSGGTGRQESAPLSLEPQPVSHGRGALDRIEEVEPAHSHEPLVPPNAHLHSGAGPPLGVNGTEEVCCL